MEFIKNLKEQIAKRSECKTCPLNGKPVVFYEKLYEGMDRCDVLFFGINPGKKEAKEGRPFIGPSGKLLRSKLQEHGLNTSRIAFTNAILCSTPNEKDIPDVEKCISNCKSLARDTIKYLFPRFFVPVGRNCTEYLFGIRGSITKISGNFYGVNNNIMPLIHPASLIYDRRGSNLDIFDRSLKQLKERVNSK